jgi:hypothetical protein
MDQPFESDVMDDLAAETPLSSAHDHYDHYGDSGDNLTDLDHHFDATIHRELSGGTASRDPANPVEDPIEGAIAAALATPTTDAFLRRLSQSLRQIANQPASAKKNGRHSPRGKSSHPSRGASGRAIAQAATLVTQLARSGADAEDALQAFLDLAETEPNNPSVAPVIAGLSLHSTMADEIKGAAQRQRLVHSVGRATQTLAQQQGSQAMAAMPRILEVVQRNARAQQIPPAELPGAIQRITRQVAANGDLVHRLAQAAPPIAPTPLPPQSMTVAKGTVQRLVFDRPVELTIRYL